MKRIEERLNTKPITRGEHCAVYAIPEHYCEFAPQPVQAVSAEILIEMKRNLAVRTGPKPMPGLFEQAVLNFPDIDAHSSIMIGDSLSDMEFGRRLGMMCILIEGDPVHRKSGIEEARGLAELTCSSLAEAVDLLLEARPPGTNSELS